MIGQARFLLELHEVEPLRFEQVVGRTETFRQPRLVQVRVLLLQFREHVGRDAVRDHERAAIVVLDLRLLADAPRNDRPVQEVVLDNLLEELGADVADARGILEGGGLSVHAAVARIVGEIQQVPQLLQVHAVEHVQRDVTRVGVVNRVQQRNPAQPGIRRHDSAGHPVVGVENATALVQTADVFDVRVDDLLLELRRIGQGPAVVGTAVALVNGGADQVYVLRIELVAFLNPLALAQPRLFAEPPGQVDRDQVGRDAADRPGLCTGR